MPSTRPSPSGPGRAPVLPDELSGGQRQMAFLAMTIAQQTDVLLLDEPLNNLDMKHAVQIMRALRRLCDEHGRTVILVIHDINFAANYSDHIVALKHGVLRFSGPVDEVVTEQRLGELYDLDFEIVPNGRGRLCNYFTPLEHERVLEDQAPGSGVGNGCGGRPGGLRRRPRKRRKPRRRWPRLSRSSTSWAPPRSPTCPQGRGAGHERGRFPRPARRADRRHDQGLRAALPVQIQGRARRAGPGRHRAATLSACTRSSRPDPDHADPGQSLSRAGRDRAHATFRRGLQEQPAHPHHHRQATSADAGPHLRQGSAGAAKGRRAGRQVEEARRVTAGRPEKAMIVMHNNGAFSAFGVQSRYAFVFDALACSPPAPPSRPACTASRYPASSSRKPTPTSCTWWTAAP